MCWIHIHNDDMMSVREFVKHVKLIVYGDDNALGVSDEKKDIFNQWTIAEAMSFFGQKYTAENKEDDPPKLRSIYDIEFLKRTFRYEPRLGRHVAPLRMATIVEMPYWTKKEGYDEIWRDNFDNALKELSLHPPEKFEERASEMLARASEAGHFPLIIDRNTLVDEITNSENLYH